METLTKNILEDEKKLQEWALVAPFHGMDQLNRFVQPPGGKNLTPSENIIKFKRKLLHWKNYVAKENSEMFPGLSGCRMRKDAKHVG